MAITDRVAVLEDKHGQLAADLSELGGGLQDEVRRAQRDVAALGGTVSELAQTVSDSLGDPAANPAVVDWFTLDRDAARKAWDGLVDWVSRYLLATWELTRFDLPDCWMRHAAIRDELSWLWCAHRAAYAPYAQPATAAHWHTMWRTAALRTIGDITNRTQCEPGQCRGQETGHSAEYDRKTSTLSTPNWWLFDGIETDLAYRPEPPDDQEQET